MNTTNALVGVIALVIIVGGLVMFSGKGDTDTAAMKKDAGITVDATETNKEKAMTPEKKEEGVMVGGSLMVASLDIIDNAVKANNVTTVVAAVKAAGLVDTLKGAGPFTVFAPTNAAFEKLPAGTVETLLKPENKAKLASILTYHVVTGRYTSANLKDGMMLKTVNGQEIKITVKDGKVMVNGSAIVETADVISSNGVTHVIDGVLLPK